MAATVEICESNGATETIAHAITQSNYGSVDSPNLNAVNNPLIPGDNAFEKWQRLHVTAMGGSAVVRNLRYFGTAPAANTSQNFNGHTVQATYDGANHKQTVYAQAAITATRTPETVPVVAPATGNIGIGGSLLGEISAAPAFSDYIVSQVRTTAAATAGTTLTITFRYDEVA